MTNQVTNRPSYYNQYTTNPNESSSNQIKRKGSTDPIEEPSSKIRKIYHLFLKDLTETNSKTDLVCQKAFNEEQATQDTPSTESVNSSQDPSFDINVLKLTDLIKSLQNDLELGPLERFQKFSNLFTFVPSNNSNEKEYKQLWVKIPGGHFFPEQKKVWLNLMIVQGPYNSQCFAEKELNFNTADVSYYYINASLEENEEKLYFQIRLDPWLSTSEILHIQRLPELSGTQLKSICMTILNYLKPSYIYLNDDSKITTDSKKILNLRVLLPIVSDTSKTWYTPDGFQLLPFSQMESPFELTILEGQNEEAYVKAVNLVRDTPLASLSCSKLTHWKRRYLNNYHNNKPTIHELGKAIYETSRNHDHWVDAQTQQQASDDLAEFYTTFLTVTEQSSLPEEYINALLTLYDYKLWYIST